MTATRVRKLLLSIALGAVAFHTPFLYVSLAPSALADGEDLSNQSNGGDDNSNNTATEPDPPPPPPPPPDPLLAPSTLQGQPVSPTSILWLWTDSDLKEKGYRVEGVDGSN